MQRFVFPLKKESSKIIFYIFLFAVISFYIGYHNFTLFHTGVELYSAIISLIILVIYLNSYNFTKTNYFVFWGLSSAFIGIFNLFHIFLQEGIMLFPQVTEDMKHHIWITQRFVESFSFFISFIVSRKNEMTRKVFAVYTLILTFLAVTVFWHFFVPGNAEINHVNLKYIELADFVVALIQLIALVLIICYRKQMNPKSFPIFLMIAIALTVYEFSILFSSYRYPFFNILGHSSKAIAYYIIYKAVSKIKLQVPFHKLIEELAGRNKELEEKTRQLERDITERKNAESLLRESEERYRSLIMNLNECFVFSQIILDDDGKPVDCITLEGNNAFFELIGQKREEVIGKRAIETTPVIKNTTPNFFDICGKVALTGEKANFEMCFDDIGRWVDISCYSLTKGYFITIFFDITDRKLAEEEIRKLTRGIEQSPSVIVITNTRGEIEYVNPKFTEVTGYTGEEAIGKNPNILKSGYHPHSIYDDLWKTIQKGEEWRGEFLNKKKSGDLYWTIISVSPIRNQESMITHYVEVQEDITEQKLLQQEVEENNRKLEEALEKQKITQGQLIQQEKLAGIGQLAAGVAHEINNPLGFVMSNFETLQKYIGRLKETIDLYRNVKTCLAKEDAGGIDQIVQCVAVAEASNKVDFISEDLEDLYKVTYDGLGRISKIVTSLRNFSRVDQQNEFTEYDLNAGIKNTLVVAHNEIKYHANIEERLGNIPTIYANGGQINQVLLNMIINSVQAIKAKHSGETGMIRITTTHDDQYVYCDIEDDGTGIADEHLNRIFEPFYTTKKVGEGTGLGLSISYDIIVHKHKGELSVDSTLGAGARFTVKLLIREGTVERME